MRCQALFLSLLSLTAFAKGGHSGSGGDPYTQLYRMLCLNVADEIRGRDFSEISKDEAVKGKKGPVMVDWALFEAACKEGEVSPAVDNSGEWEDLRDAQGKRRSITFHAYAAPNENGFYGSLMIQGERFKKDIRNDLPVALITVVHENFKVMGLREEKDALSARFFQAYGADFMKKLIGRSEMLRETMNDWEERRSIATYYDESIDEIAEVRREKAKLAVLKSKTEYAQGVSEHMTRQIKSIAAQIKDDNAEGEEILKRHDEIAKAAYYEQEANRKERRKAMDEFAAGVEKQLKSITILGPMFPSTSARTVGAGLRIQAAEEGLPGVMPYPEQIGWLSQQAGRLETRILERTALLQQYESKKKELDLTIGDAAIELMKDAIRDFKKN